MKRSMLAPLLAPPLLTALAGCTDLKPLQAQIEDLRKDVTLLRKEVADARQSAQDTADQALATAQSSHLCCDVTNDKIEGMFRRHLGSGSSTAAPSPR
jgi:hypothetical protein